MVLWTLILLAMLATVFADNARTEVLLARNLVDNAQAEALADGGLYRAVAGLSREPSEGGFQGDGRVYTWQTEAGEARFSIRDEGGKIDLNQAPDVLLRELFIVLGAPPGQAASLADAIIDFRDEDDEKRPRGAEFRDYKALRLGYPPKNERFVLIDELMYVPGMTPELFRKLGPLLTVHGQEEVPHELTAPPEVKAAVIAALNAPRGPSTKPTAEASRSSRSTSDAQTAIRSESTSSRSSFGSSSGLGTSSSGSGSSFGSKSSFGSSSSYGTSSGFGSGSSFGGRSSFGSRSLDDAEGGSEALGDDDNEEPEERSGVTVFSVHVEARTPNGTVYVREATVDLTSSEDAPFVTYAWRQGEQRLFPRQPGRGETALPEGAPSTP